MIAFCSEFVRRLPGSSAGTSFAIVYIIMILTSEAFTDGGKIPDQYTMYGDNLIPPIHINEVPPEARSLVLIVDDPDAPKGTFTHWVLFNMDTCTRDIDERHVPANAVPGTNDFGSTEYGGPKPPSGEHRYFFKAFALDSSLSLPHGVKRTEVEAAMKDHVVAHATLMGKYAH